MPRRSNGCISCKTRRVKCDEHHPTCLRCRKAGIECKGYIELVFIDEKPRVERGFAVERAQREDLRIRRDGDVGGLYHSHTMNFQNQDAVFQNISTELELAPSGFKENIIFSFLMRKLFEGRLEKIHSENQMNAGNEYSNTWIEEAVSMEQPLHVIRPLAFMVFGQAHQCENMIRESRMEYGRALRELRKCLADPGRKEAFGPVSGVTALAMFEILDRRTEPAWSFHAEGLGLLMHAGGPKKYQRGPEKSIFHDQRVLLLSKAIFLGQSTFLSEPKWKTIPWENDPLSKQPIDYLLDTLSDTASYLAEFANHTKGEGEGMDITDLLRLKTQVEGSLQELDIWWHNTIAGVPNICWEINPDSRGTFTRDENGLVFETVLEYKTLWMAYTICTYDATRILLLQTHQKVHKGLSKYPNYRPSISASTPSKYQSDSVTRQDHEDKNRHTVPLLGITTDIRGLAHEIFRSLEYCHLNSQQYMGSYSCIFVPDIAYFSIDAGSREAKWFWSRIRPVGDLGGGGFRKGIKVLPCCQFGRQ